MKSDIESFFGVQVMYVVANQTGFRIIEPQMIEKPVSFVHKLYDRKSSSKLLYGSVNLNQLSSNRALEVLDLSKLAKFLGYDFEFDQCYKNGISVEYYRLQTVGKKLKGFHSNSVPGKCAKYDTKLRIGVLEDKIFWLPSTNLIMNRIYCNREDCLMSFNYKADWKRHQLICSSEQHIKTKQIPYGDSRHELEQLVQKGYLPESFNNFRATQMAVFDIECLESKVHTASPEYGASVLANQVVCSIGRCTEHIENFPCDRCIYRCIIKYWSLQRNVFCPPIFVSGRRTKIG